ncbi:MAG: SGNH/GDSL hydrolase family protein [Myxococcales bacterium]|nr:SGNH/GDSL hydrolase family protein [Myxococcales bacterium]MDD9969573.1 SGNH/GDSL hydrolase family protein [Myxococcales bacterium]
MAIARKNERTPLQRFNGDRRRHPDRPVVLCEGDSWFAYPGTNLVRELHALSRRKMTMLNLQDNGDEVTEMLAGKQRQKLRKRLARYRFDLILFSGGGNDMVGEEFERLLLDAGVGGSWRDWIRMDRFERRLGQIRDSYLDLIGLRDDGKNPACPIVVHGYDRPHPSPTGFKLAGLNVSGPWMYPGLVKRNITKPADQCRIAGFCIDAFNDMIRELATEHEHVHYIATPGTLKRTEWADEIHPTRAGFKKLSRKYLPTLRRLLPATFRSQPS